ncbi:MAG: TcpQ domain-containing protein [Alphaproteobacteria bacterium]
MAWFARQHRLLLSLALGIIGVTLMCGTAQAGFQWVTPLEEAPAAVPLAPAPVPAPVEDVPAVPLAPAPADQAALPAPMQLPEVSPPAAASPVASSPQALAPMEPLPLEPMAAVASPVPLPPIEPSPIEPSAPLSVPPPELAPTLAADVPPPLPVDQGPAIVGFGKKIPLTVALKQILPPDYGFALEQGIDNSTSVDWQGGKPWRTVLNDALTGAGLSAQEEGKIVKIARAGLGGKTGVHAASAAPLEVPAPLPVAELPTEAPPVPSAAAAATPAGSDMPAPVAGAPPEAMMVPLPPLETPATAAALPPVVDDSMIAAAAAPALAADAPPPLPPVEPAPASVPPAKDAVDAVQPITAAPPSDAPPVTGSVVTPSPLTPATQAAPAEAWKAEPGDQLRAVIKKWSERANVELVWATEYDYPIQASVNFSGSFEDAVRNLLSGFVDAKPQPFGRLHDNPTAGQRILVIETRGNSGGE